MSSGIALGSEVGIASGAVVAAGDSVGVRVAGIGVALARTIYAVGSVGVCVLPQELRRSVMSKKTGAILHI